MNIFKKSLPVFILLISALNLNSQDMVKILVQKGDKSYGQLHYSNALSLYRQSYQKASKLATASVSKNDIALKIADCYWLTRNYDSASYWYGKVSSSNSDDANKIQYRKAELSAIMGNYAAASTQMNLVPGFSDRAAGFNRVAKMNRDSADWRIRFLETVNTDYFKEYSPLLIDTNFIWTTNQPKKFNLNGIMAWDNMGYSRMLQVGDTSKLSATEVSAARKLYDQMKLDAKQPDPLAQHFSGSDIELKSLVRIPSNILPKLKSIQEVAVPVEGTDKFAYNLAHATYSAATGKIYFSSNRQDKLKNQIRTIGIVEAQRNGASLTNAKFIFPGSSESSFMHPAIHPNGKVLVFSSNQAGGKGGFDLYMAEKETDSTWSTPKLLPVVNTAGNEVFPSFTKEGILYFSSDGHAGLGGLDIYKIDMKGILEHLPSPVNSSYDDFGVTFAAAGTSGYFTSDRLGSDDIYKFNYEKKIVKITGVVTSEETGKGKPGVKVILYEKNDKGEYVAIDSMLTDANGKFSFNGRPNREYRVEVIDPSGNQTVDFNTNGNFGAKNVGEIKLKDKKPEVVVPPAAPESFKYIVYFDFDKSKITPESKVILEEAKATMDKYSDYKCMLDGHTDLEGTEKYNDRLSAKRSKVVKAYLVKAGIVADRISTESFGEKSPVPGTSAHKEPKNRRVEITIMK